MVNDDNPWAGSHEDFMRDVMPKLDVHGKAIGLAAKAGDAVASEIIDRYVMLHRSYDPMTAILIELLLTKWLQTNTGSGTT